MSAKRTQTGHCPSCGERVWSTVHVDEACLNCEPPEVR